MGAYIINRLAMNYESKAGGKNEKTQSCTIQSLCTSAIALWHDSPFHPDIFNIYDLPNLLYDLSELLQMGYDQ